MRARSEQMCQVFLGGEGGFSAATDKSLTPLPRGERGIAKRHCLPIIIVFNGQQLLWCRGKGREGIAEWPLTRRFALPSSQRRGRYPSHFTLPSPLEGKGPGVKAEVWFRSRRCRKVPVSRVSSVQRDGTVAAACEHQGAFATERLVSPRTWCAPAATERALLEKKLQCLRYQSMVRVSAESRS